MPDPFRQTQIGSKSVQALQTVRKTAEYFVPDDLLRSWLELTKDQHIVEIRRSVGKTQQGDDIGIRGSIVIVVDLS